MSDEDYYSVLGIGRDATEDDVRRAYKAAAKREHPDRNPGDSDAEARFKRIGEAYATLSDPEKRSAYDRWGSGGPPRGGGGFDPFGGFGDMFSEIFGRGGGGPRRGGRPRGPVKGGDVRVAARVPLRDAMKGGAVEVSLDLPTPCETCSGAGGTGRVPCGDCAGSGQVMQRQGFMSVFHTCGRCSGRGERVETPCAPCRGEGHVTKRKRLSVSVPPGIATGQQLRVAGGGLGGVNGGPPGDAFVAVEVLMPPGWGRDGDDLVAKVSVPLHDAVLGGETSIEMPDGERATLSVPPGSQPLSEVVVAGLGMPRLRAKGTRGALRAVLDVRVPGPLTGRARELMEELRGALSV